MVPEHQVKAVLYAVKDGKEAPHFRRATEESTQEKIEQPGMWSIELLMMDWRGIRGRQDASDRISTAVQLAAATSEGSSTCFIRPSAISSSCHHYMHLAPSEPATRTVKFSNQK